MLVFEYLPNGSIHNHLYGRALLSRHPSHIHYISKLKILPLLSDTGRESATKLEFKQRLSIAIGTAKGIT